MLPPYVEGMSILWFADGEWRHAALAAVSTSEFRASVDRAGALAESDAAHVTVTAEPHPDPIGSSRWNYRLHVRVAPGRNAVPMGVQLVLVLDASVRCVWKPHLSPEQGMAIGDRVFRSPAMVAENERHLVALLADVDELERNRPVPHVMDYERDGHSFMYGLCHYAETGHVYYRLEPQPFPQMEELSFRFELLCWDKEAPGAARDMRPVERALWERFARRRMIGSGDPSGAGQGGSAAARGTPGGGGAAEAAQGGGTPAVEATGAKAATSGETPPAEAFLPPDCAGTLPDPRSLLPYVRHAYGWAFDRWKDVIWQQFELAGRTVGGVAFLVTAQQKPGMGMEGRWREPKSLWNQAWFSGLRSVYGLALWGERMNRPDWTDKAERALEFALSAPQMNGLFPAYYQADEAGSWEAGGWVMSAPRRPPGHEAYVHLLDSSWTCCWLLKWHRDLRPHDPRIVPYVRRYAERLMALQREDGGFPAWVRPDTLVASDYLAVSPETSLHVVLLCMLHELEPNARLAERATLAINHVLREVVATGRWEDFETYWSCAKEWAGKRYGEPDRRSGLYNQCNFGIYWTAEALKAMYKQTGEARYLAAGERVLAELSLYQQIWEPPFFPVPTLGGFGVMTSDDEWNDARQSLFAVTYIDYYRLTGNESYLARGLWAMQASFYMMYCPDNPRTKRLYEAVHPFFGEAEYGFHMENFNHHDGTSVQGLGEFTIFDWGCGAAAASLAELLRSEVEHRITDRLKEGTARTEEE